MFKGNLSVEEAKAIVGVQVIDDLLNRGVEPTCAVGYNGSMQGDTYTEWCRSVTVNDSIITVWYYTNADDDAAIFGADGDGAAADWDRAFSGITIE